MRRRFSVLLLTALLSACGGSSESDSFLDLSDADLSAHEEHFAPIAREGELLEELRSGPADAQAVRAFVEAAYSEDVVFHDTTFGAHDEGYDAVASMYQTFLSYFDDAEIAWWPPLIGDTTAISVIPFWNMTLGPYSFTADAPLIEVDLLAMDDGRIGTNTILYDLASLARIYSTNPSLDGEIQQRYAEAWSSGSRSDVAALYSEEVERHDGLAGIDATGIEAVADEASRWVSELDDPSWEVKLAFAESLPDALGERMGAVFTVTSDGCGVDVAVLFEVTAEGRIVRELVHYDPASLRACGWAD